MASRRSAYPSTYFIAAGVIVTLFQLVMLLRLEFNFTSNKETRDPMLLSSALMVLYIVNTCLVFGGYIYQDQAIMLSGIFLIGITGVIYLMFENRYPDFYQLAAREQREKKYKKSLILGLSKDKIIDRLHELMEVEKVYRQFDLKLDEVAAMLLITPHQLSEFVNDCMGMTFSSYVNSYRVKEAKKLLGERPIQLVFDR